MQQGWIKLHRKIQDHWIYQEKRKFSRYEAWLDMLMMASHKDTKFVLGTEVVELSKGSFVTSELKLMERWGWSKERVRHFFKLLENDSMITKKSDRKKTMINICNYSIYHDPQTDNRPLADHTTRENALNLDTTERPHQTIDSTGLVEVGRPDNRPLADHQQTTDRTQSRSKELKNIDDGEIESLNKALEERFIQLRNKGLFLSADDYQAIDQVVQVGVPSEQAMKWLNECFAQYKPKFNGDSISSFKYCRKYILDQYHRTKKNTPPKTPDIDPFLLKIKQMEEEAKRSRGDTECPS